MGVGDEIYFKKKVAFFVPFTIDSSNVECFSVGLTPIDRKCGSSVVRRQVPDLLRDVNVTKCVIVCADHRQVVAGDREPANREDLAVTHS